jgi:hypothetical protein
MSGSLLAVSSVAGIGTQALSASGLMPALIRAPRRIGTVIPDVTIEEDHSDRLTVTQHPIADGSPVSDHAYKMPGTITMRLGFSNSNVVGAGVQGFMSGGGFADLAGGISGLGSGLLSSFTEQRASDIYAQLLKLQFDQSAWDQGKVALNAFKLVTGKRTYPNVVITELSVRTDHTSEYALMIDVHMQEVFIVTTAATTQPAQTDQSQAPQTASPSDQPDKTATPTGPRKSIINELATGMGLA